MQNRRIVPSALTWASLPDLHRRTSRKKVSAWRPWSMELDAARRCRCITRRFQRASKGATEARIVFAAWCLEGFHLRAQLTKVTPSLVTWSGAAVVTGRDHLRGFFEGLLSSFRLHDLTVIRALGNQIVGRVGLGGPTQDIKSPFRASVATMNGI